MFSFDLHYAIEKKENKIKIHLDRHLNKISKILFKLNKNISFNLGKLFLENLNINLLIPTARYYNNGNMYVHYRDEYLNEDEYNSFSESQSIIFQKSISNNCHYNFNRVGFLDFSNSVIKNIEIIFLELSNVLFAGCISLNNNDRMAKNPVRIPNSANTFKVKNFENLDCHYYQMTRIKTIVDIKNLYGDLNISIT